MTSLRRSKMTKNAPADGLIKRKHFISYYFWHIYKDLESGTIFILSFIHVLNN